jgi:hypothetical protein
MDGLERMVNWYKFGLGRLVSVLLCAPTWNLEVDEGILYLKTQCRRTLLA